MKNFHLKPFSKCLQVLKEEGLGLGLGLGLFYFSFKIVNFFFLCFFYELELIYKI